MDDTSSEDQEREMQIIRVAAIGILREFSSKTPEEWDQWAALEIAEAETRGVNIARKQAIQQEPIAWVSQEDLPDKSIQTKLARLFEQQPPDSSVPLYSQPSDISLSVDKLYKLQEHIRILLDKYKK